MDDLLVIVLKYLEEGSTANTMECLEAAGIKPENIYFADREGVGNMSRAFNVGLNDALFFHPHNQAKYRFVWWVTNVQFTPDVPEKLYRTLKSDDRIAAIHPAHQSDHLHLRVGYKNEVTEVPFIELTAPMFSLNALRKVGLMDSELPYWGMDLDWSFSAKKEGYKLAYHPAKVEHVYLRFKNVKVKDEISLIRERLRTYHDKATEQRLIQKYGQNWRLILWP